MKVKSLFYAMTLSLLLLLPAGCGTGEDLTEWAAEKANDGLEEIGGGIQEALDRLHNAEYQGGPFENNLESARAYLLAQLQEKYGIAFYVVGNEDLENYGPIAGATYTCDVAPADAPEQVTTALVSQTAYKDVRDGYAVYFFKEEAEEPVSALCESKEYVIDHRVSLEMPETSYRWTADDGLKNFLSQSGAYVRVTLYFEDDLNTETYAEQILDFLQSMEQLNCNLIVQPRANNTYIFFAEAQILDGFDAGSYTLEEIDKMVERRLKTGDPQ